MTPDEMFLIIIFGILVFMFIFVATILPRMMAIRSKGGFKQYPMNENSMMPEDEISDRTNQVIKFQSR